MIPQGRLKILLVDDDDEDVAKVGTALQGSRTPLMAVAHAATLAEALQHICEGAPDVGLLDPTLPDSHGLNALIRIREIAPHLPIVIMTELDDVSFASQVIELGAQEYVVKDATLGQTVPRAILHARSRMHSVIERETMVSHLADAIEMKKKLFGVLAHDLRNPLSVIMGYSDLLAMNLEERSDPKLQAIVSNIRESSDFALALIKDVMSMAVSEAENIALNLRSFDLSKVTGRLVAQNSILARKKNITIRYMPPSIAPLPLVADLIKIEEVVNNLIGNAIKFSNPGGTIDVSTDKEARGIRLVVADHGVGIPADMMDRLFTPFCKGMRGTAGESSNGLGLYICDQIVKAHGGRIEVDSRPNQGASFQVTIPYGFS